jgi:hypothetical protein
VRLFTMAKKETPAEFRERLQHEFVDRNNPFFLSQFDAYLQGIRDGKEIQAYWSKYYKK